MHEETGKKAGMALPPSFFSARSQRGLLAISGEGAPSPTISHRLYMCMHLTDGLLAVSGAGATLLIADRAAFVTRFVAVRFWLMQLAVVLQRTAVDPQPHCDSPWIPTDRQTHNAGGYRGKWYTPGWPWPFNDGVGVVVGNCTYPHGVTAPQPRSSECCSVIFGKVSETRGCPLMR